MSEFLGTIITAEGSPSTSEFQFVIDKNAHPMKGQYVQVNEGEKIIFGYISEIVRANRYFERAESVAEYSKNTDISKHFPTESWEYTNAMVKILGTHAKGKFQRSFSPPKPGSKVMNTQKNILEPFLGFKENGMFLGSIQHHDVPVRIDLTRMFQKHVAILAMSGAGKSHLSSVLLEEILDRSKDTGRIATVVIDIHGEYVGFAHDSRYGNNTKIINGKEIHVPLRKISPEVLSEWMPNISSVQRELLRGAMTALRKEKTGEAYGLKELVAKVMDSPETKNEQAKLALKRALQNLRGMRLISKNKENPLLVSDVKPGRLLIVDLSEVDSHMKKQITVTMLARKLFRLRKKGRIPPFLFLVEEAHNFASQAETEQCISRSVIETIAREGRKFGASLCLVSQRPVNLSTTALSQCNTHIILRVTNPNDLDHIQMSSEGIDSHTAKSITGLQVGEAIIVGAAVNHPVFVSVRERKSEKREKGLPLEEQAKKFEEEIERKEKNVEAFL